MHVIAVIPAHNEAATIADVAARTGRYVDRVIVVEDGSSDGTADRLTELPIILIRNPANLGKAASLWRGIEHALRAGAQAIVTLDGDGQHRPEEIPRLLTAARQHPQRIIIGARLRGRARAPRLRRFANRCADFGLSWLAGYPIADSQSGFRLYPAALLRQLDIPHDRAQSFVWESEVLLEAARLGFASLPVAVDTIYDPAMRASHYQPLADTARIVRMGGRRLLLGCLRYGRVKVTQA